MPVEYRVTSDSGLVVVRTRRVFNFSLDFGGLFLGFNGFTHGIKSAEPADEDRGRGHAESTERGGE